MIDHTGVNVTNYQVSKEFYLKALAPIKYKIIKEFSASVAGVDVAGMGEDPKADFWLIAGDTQKPHVHIAFRAETRVQVDEFYKAAIAAGGKDNGKPGIRAHYHANYYGAFVFDPDGHNIEVVCHT